MTDSIKIFIGNFKKHLIETIKSIPYLISVLFLQFYAFLKRFIRTKIIPNMLYYTLLYPLSFYYKFLCDCTFEGEAHIVENLDEGFIIAANHSSYLDWLVLNLNFVYKLKLSVAFLAKEKVLNHHIWGPIASKCNCIEVKKNGRIATSNRNDDHLSSQKYIVIFPEGTRTPKGEFIKAKTGVVKISVAQKLPIIPTGLIGFYDAWPRHKIFPRPHKLKVIFGKPYYPKIDEITKKSLERETRVVMSFIGKLIDKKYPF